MRAALWGDVFEAETKRVFDEGGGKYVEVLVPSHIVKPKVMALLVKIEMERNRLLGLYKQDEDDPGGRVSIEVLLREIDETPAHIKEITLAPPEDNGGPKVPGGNGPMRGTT
jgi:hypothetical protein